MEFLFSFDWTITSTRHVFMMMGMVRVVHVFAIMFATSGMAIQQFARTPQMQTTVTKGDTVILECVIANIGGKCSWEKDGLPVGLYPDKYTWRTNGDNGDWR